MSRETPFRIGKPLVLSNVSTIKKSDNVLVLSGGKVSKLNLDSIAKKNSNSLITSGAVYAAINNPTSPTSRPGQGSAVGYWTAVTAGISYSAGNVGIKTTNPTKPLEVTGDALITGTLNAIIALQVGGTDISAIYEPIITGAATTIVGSDLTINRAVISNGSGKIAVSATTSTELGYVSGVTSSIQTQINTLSASSFWVAATGGINYAGGNVGIGTVSPSSLLHIDGGAGNGELYLESAATGQSQLLFGASDGQGKGAGYIKYSDNGDLLLFGTDTQDQMVILSSGNVGIKTINPGTELEVNGTINAVTALQVGGVDISSIYEPALGNPGTDGHVLSSTTGGTRSWIGVPTQSSSTWTVLSSPGGSPTLTSTIGRYVKTGLNVFVEFRFTVPANSDSSQVTIGPIPFTSVDTEVAMGIVMAIDGGGNIETHSCKVSGNETTIQFHEETGAAVAWDWDNAAGFTVYGSLTYISDEF